jgi:hypothetical protein
MSTSYGGIDTAPTDIEIMKERRENNSKNNPKDFHPYIIKIIFWYFS